jgi:plastocyanin
MNSRTRHTFTALVGLASVLFVGLAQVGTVSAATNPHVDILGGGDLGDPSVQVPYYFKQGRIVVHPGETVTWRNLTVEPHSISIVDPSALPATAAEVDSCKQCDQYLGLHAPSIGPEGPQPPFVGALDNSRSSAAQLPQLKSLGDSILVSEQGNSYPSTIGGSITDSVSAAITAARGTTLTYFCALHPWMQGTIEVR